MAKKEVIQIHLGVGADYEARLEFIGGPRPYIWFGNDFECGYINDRSIQKLHKWCTAILKSKKQKK